MQHLEKLKRGFHGSSSWNSTVLKAADFRKFLGIKFT